MNRKQTIIPKRGEIWLIEFPKNKENRKPWRPCLIISNNIQNEHDIFLVLAPLTSDDLKIVRPFELLIIKNKENGLDQNSKVLFNQIHSIDKIARCQKYLGRLETNFLEEADKKLKLVLALE